MYFTGTTREIQTQTKLCANFVNIGGVRCVLVEVSPLYYEYLYLHILFLP